MMHKVNTYVIGIFLIIAVISCSEHYYPQGIDSEEKIPVIQGIIVDNETPVVKIYWASEYEADNFEYISGAKVSVKDELGNIAVLQQDSTGQYVSSDPTFLGNIGRSYVLEVLLPNGNTYASEPEQMQTLPVIDSIYAIPEKKSLYRYNSSNEPILEEKTGLSISTDLSVLSDHVMYFRINTSVMKLMIRSMRLGCICSYPLYMWHLFDLDNSYTVNYTVKHGDKQVLLNHTSGFLEYYYDKSLEEYLPDGTYNTAPYTTAWVISQNVYSLSQDVYEYYNSIAKQLNADNELFSPTPSQIQSNISCVNKPDEKVIGVFEASSVITVYKAFKWLNLYAYNHKELTYFPDDIEDGMMEKFPPYFWISF